jgi:hypothetical protein
MGSILVDKAGLRPDGAMLGKDLGRKAPVMEANLGNPQVVSFRGEAPWGQSGVLWPEIMEILVCPSQWCEVMDFEGPGE